ncbi:MAG: REP-associated tyrosine transposase [Ginsengibacter sp.]
MNQNFPIEGAQFFTATIYQWNHLLSDDNHKNIIVESLKFLVTDNRIDLNAFIIMSNHIHLIWQPLPGFTSSNIQSSFMKFTAQQLKRSLIKNNIEALSVFKVNKYDREYQIWKREPLSIELISEDLFKQKLEYIHYNPVKAGLCQLSEDYHFSSAKFYEYGIDCFGMLKHYSGN